jgi:hypothetical protein
VEVLVNLSQEPVSFSEGDATVSKTPEELLRDPQHQTRCRGFQ